MELELVPEHEHFIRRFACHRLRCSAHVTCKLHSVWGVGGGQKALPVLTPNLQLSCVAAPKSLRMLSIVVRSCVCECLLLCALPRLNIDYTCCRSSRAGQRGEEEREREGKRAMLQASK